MIIDKRKSGKNNHNYGKSLSKEHRLKVSKGLKLYHKKRRGEF